MAASVKVTGIVPTIRMMQDVEKLLKSKTPITQITDGVKKEVLKRTSAGKDFENKKFHPYSEGYKKKKGSSFVNLRLSGKMLGALHTKIINFKHGRVYIMSRRYASGILADILANIHTTGTGRQPRREFMNVRDSVLTKLKKKYLDTPIQKILGRR